MTLPSTYCAWKGALRIEDVPPIDSLMEAFGAAHTIKGDLVRRIWRPYGVCSCRGVAGQLQTKRDKPGRGATDALKAVDVMKTRRSAAGTAPEQSGES